MREQSIHSIEKALIGGLYLKASVYFDHHKELHVGLFSNDKTLKLFNELKRIRESNRKPEIISLSDKLSIPSEFITDCTKEWRSKPTEYIDALQSNFLKDQLSGIHSNAAMEIESGTDPIEATENASKQANEIIGTNLNEDCGIKAACLEAMDEIQEAKNNKGVVGISTGTEDLDDMIGGFCKGDQVVLAARPGMGKTTLAANWLIEVAKQDIPVMFFSLEMTKARFMQVLAAIISGVSTKKMRNGDITAKEDGLIQDAFDWLYQKPIYISTSSRTIDQIIGSARYYARKHNVKVFFYDYIQIFKGGEKGWNTTYRIVDYSQRLKAFANDYKVSNVVLCQVNRSVDRDGNNLKPNLAHIKDSGSIEQDATAVLMMYLPEPKENPNLFQIILRKNRFGDKSSLMRLWVKRKFIMTDQLPTNEESTPF